MDFIFVKMNPYTQVDEYCKVRNIMDRLSLLTQAYVTWLQESTDLWLFWMQHIPNTDKRHPAFVASPLTRTLSVKPAALEKKELRFWSASRLQDMIAKGGQIITTDGPTNSTIDTVDTLRPNFIPVLNAALHFLNI